VVSQGKVFGRADLAAGIRTVGQVVRCPAEGAAKYYDADTCGSFPQRAIRYWRKKSSKQNFVGARISENIPAGGDCMYVIVTALGTADFASRRPPFRGLKGVTADVLV
jgi:hypothetical protein